MGKALYRKYRSRKLSEIVGQEHVTTLLENALKSGRVAHAYLFTGPRGVGKTSIARILAHEINELPYSDESTHLDIIEIDAASNNGVDDIRDLRERVNLAPTSAKKKIYIIDEVHMLSKAAFNALLKTLEEPPEHVVFILATTDLDKLPETIVSRTQRHTFRRATKEHIVENLTRIAKQEKIAIEKEALELIAEHADGSFRDSVSLFDQLANVASGEKITADMIEKSLGLAPRQAIIQLVDATTHKNFPALLEQLKSLEANGVQASIIARQLIGHILAHSHETPQLLTLVDQLLNVGQSSMPSAALLACLGAYAAPSKSVPSIATQPAPTVLKELEIKATELHPKDDIITKQSSSATTPTSKPTAPAKANKEAIQAEKQPAATPKAPPATSESLVDWQQLVESSKQASIGLSSVLAKCGSTSSDGVITIYTRTEFFKKKLMASSYQQILHTLLTEQSGYEWEIEFVPGMPPSSNSEISAVAAIMGGGEEVELSE
ncbi:MAG TPA: DNA polymerase III subunit gamma/tau [Candidatus Saccharimonadales bacterium]